MLNKMLENNIKEKHQKKHHKRTIQLSLTFLQTQMSCNAEGKARGNKINKITT